MGAVRSLHGCHLRLSGSGTRPRAREHPPIGNSGAGNAAAGPDAVARCAGAGGLAARAPAQYERRRRAPCRGSLRSAAGGVLRAGARRLPDARRRGAAAHGSDRCLRLRRWRRRANFSRAAFKSMDFLTAESLPWLHGLEQRVRDALTANRLPHALLLLSVPGLGAELLANWIAALA